MAIAILVAGATTAAGQTADELVARNIEAKGGLAKLQAVQSLKQTSHMSMQGMQATLTVYAKRPNLIRQELTVGGQQVISAYDGAMAWMLNPLVGASNPMSISGPQADIIREQSSFDGPLVDYRTKGYMIEAVGQEKVGEVDTYHLKLTSPSKLIMHLYLDAKTGLDFMLVTETATGRLEQIFSDYRDVNGIKMPFGIRTLVNGVQQTEMTVDSVEFNVAIDNAIFRMTK